MRKIYKKLTNDQKLRGVIFSSTLTEGNKTELITDTIHEVTKENLYKCSEGTDKIKLLLDDSFFSGSDSPFKYNIIRK